MDDEQNQPKEAEDNTNRQSSQRSQRDPVAKDEPRRSAVPVAWTEESTQKPHPTPPQKVLSEGVELPAAPITTAAHEIKTEEEGNRSNSSSSSPPKRNEIPVAWKAETPPNKQPDEPQPPPEPQPEEPKPESQTKSTEANNANKAQGRVITMEGGGWGGLSQYLSNDSGEQKPGKLAVGGRPVSGSGDKNTSDTAQKNQRRHFEAAGQNRLPVAANNAYLASYIQANYFTPASNKSNQTHLPVPGARNNIDDGLVFLKPQASEQHLVKPGRINAAVAPSVPSHSQNQTPTVARTDQAQKGAAKAGLKKSNKVGPEQQQQATAKMQKMKRLGVPLPCAGFLDREESNEIKFGIKTICDAQNSGAMLITGNSGAGKSNLVAWLLIEERHEVFMWYECHAEVIVWMNVQRISRNFDDDALFDEVADIIDAEFGAIRPRTRVKFRNFFDKEPHRRFLFVLDELSNRKVLETIVGLGSTIRCIAITRDAKEAGLAGNRFILRTVPVRDFNDRQTLHLLDHPLREKLSFNKMKPLAPLCLGLPLIGSIMRACFVSNEEDPHKTYGFLWEALSRRTDDSAPTSEPFRTLARLLAFVLGRETNETRLYFYSFLLFDYQQPIDTVDMAVLWDLKEPEAAAICSQLHSKALLQMVEVIDSERHPVSQGYCMHYLLYKVIGDAAKLLVSSEDPNEMRSRFINPEVLHRSVTKRRKNILKRIIAEADCATLDKLCRHKYGKEGQSFFHLLYGAKWRQTTYGTMHNVSADLLANLIAKMNRGHVDTTKILAQEDDNGDSALMSIVDNRDDDQSAEHNGLKTLVLSIGQKVICQVSAVRYWTSKLNDGSDNSDLFKASLRGDYGRAEDLIRLDASLVTLVNGHGETPIMAAAGAGHLPIVRLLHRVGSASLDCADFGGMTPVLVAASTGRADVIEYLRANGATMTATSQEGRTALMLAANAGHLEAVRLILTSYEQKNSINAHDHEGATALILAAGNGHLDVTQTLLKHGADMNSINRTGNCALAVAAACGSTDVAQALIANGAKPDVTDHHGTTPLMKASLKGHLDAIQLLHSKAARINATDNNGLTPLFYAVEGGHLKAVQLLHSFGAVINATRKSGRTVLMDAVCFGNAAIIQYLIANGAALDAGDKENAVTALMLACREGKADVVDLLLASGASVSIKSKSGMTAVFVACECGHLEIVKLLHAGKAQLAAANNEGFTPLMAACEKGHRDIAEFLVANSCQPNTGDGLGQTALMKAAANGHLGVVNFLLLNGATVNAQDGMGTTALMMASDAGHLEVVRALIAKQAKVNFSDRRGATALMFAVQRGHAALVELLQSQGVDVNQKKRDGTTAMMLACKEGHSEIVQFLHAKRAELNDRDESGMTSLMEAAYHGHKEVVRYLLKNGANPNAVADDNSTPLFWAVEAGNLEVVKMLHEKGALLNARRTNGLTPLMVAAFARHDEIVAYLQQNGGR